MHRQHPATLLSLAFSLARTKQPDVTVRSLRRAQAAYPDDFWLNTFLAEKCRRREDYEGALRFWTAAVSVRPNSAAAHNNLGKALQKRDKLDEAIACFRKSIKLDRKFAVTHWNLGNALCRQKKLDESNQEDRESRQAGTTSACRSCGSVALAGRGNSC